jgi:hypothetical protein
MNSVETVFPSELVENWSPASMLEITLKEPDDFLKVRETLTRIGVASRRDSNTLYQSCHILHKQGRYFIVHFKELFILDGKPTSFTVDDLSRRNTIALLLSDWGLVTIVNPTMLHPRASLKQIKIISHSDKTSWNTVTKYSIGNVKK